MSDDYRKFGPALRAIRENRRVPRKSLCDSSLSGAQLRGIEAGSRTVSPEEFGRVCEKLSISADDVFRFERDNLELRVAAEFRDRLFSIRSARAGLILVIVADGHAAAEQEIERDASFWRRAGLIPNDGAMLRAFPAEQADADYWVAAATASIRQGGANYSHDETPLELLAKLSTYVASA